MIAKSMAVAGWGDLNVALNQLVRAGTILRYKTSRPENGGEVGIEVGVEKGADQAEIVRNVREVLPKPFSGAVIRTSEG